VLTLISVPLSVRSGSVSVRFFGTAFGSPGCCFELGFLAVSGWKGLA